MHKGRSCVCCVKFDPTRSKEDAVEEQPTFKEVFKIWKEKMHSCDLFLAHEINIILDIWILFARQRIASLPKSDANDFYCETAEFAAKKLKYFPQHGWNCLIMDFPYGELKCTEEPSVIETAPTSHSTVNNLSPVTSAESTRDFLGQVDFLLRLVASNNITLHLVRIALDKSFQPTIIEKKSPQTIILPKKYLDVDTSLLPKGKLRNHILYGFLDRFILPLQLANEVNEDFWNQIQQEIDDERID